MPDPFTIQPGPGVLLAYLGGAAAVYVLLRWLRRPLLLVAGGAVRLVLGGAAIWALDFLGRPAGLHVALNPASSLVAGFLGIPGLALLLVFGGLV